MTQHCHTHSLKTQQYSDRNMLSARTLQNCRVHGEAGVHASCARVYRSYGAMIRQSCGAQETQQRFNSREFNSQQLAFENMIRTWRDGAEISNSDCSGSQTPGQIAQSTWKSGSFWPPRDLRSCLKHTYSHAFN